MDWCQFALTVLSESGLYMRVGEESLSVLLTRATVSVKTVLPLLMPITDGKFSGSELQSATRRAKEEPVNAQSLTGTLNEQSKWAILVLRESSKERNEKNCVFYSSYADFISSVKY